MRPTLPVALLVVALIGCLVSRLDAHPANCKTAGRGCANLGLPPEEQRVKTNQREEIVADWRAQDGMAEGLDAGAIRRVVEREPIETPQVRDIRVLDFLLASRHALQYDNF